MAVQAAVPTVSVVVIVYNDAGRLAHAVRSVLAQSLHSVEVVVVDDHSSDGSYRVARRLAASWPDRVRAYQLPRNSGGCGAPRNHGLERARGRYLMFLDSDDELDRHACRNLLEAAERTGADLVSGRCVRVRPGAPRPGTTDWYPRLYARSRTLDSIAELPELLAYDTLSTNKLYRRDLLWEREPDLRFPERVHYEDLLFSARAYLAARRIALIPQRVYHWHVQPEPPVGSCGGGRSISNRRREVGNWADRIDAHRRVDAALADSQRPELEQVREVKNVKFLKHDLVLLLRELPGLDQWHREQLSAPVAGYLAELAPEAYQQAPRLPAICGHLLARGAWEQLLPSLDALLNPGTLAVPPVRRDGRTYWCAVGLDEAEGRRVLDVTEAGQELGDPTAPLARLTLGNQLTCWEALDEHTVQLSGSVVNPLGRLRSGPSVRGRLELRAPRRSRRAFTVPLSSLRRGPRWLDWDAEVDVTRVPRPLGLVDTSWEVRLVLDVDGARLVTQPAVTGGLPPGPATVRARPRLTRLVGDRLRPEVSPQGRLVLRLTAAGGLPAAVRAGLDRALDGPVARVVTRWAGRARRRLSSRTTKVWVYRHLLRRLPLRRGQLVFECHLGLSYGDSPKAVYEELRRQGVDCRPVWCYARTPDGFPRDAVLVRRWSWRYLLALARAEWWIDNQGFPAALPKPTATRYLQTWHGTPVKRMGADLPEHRALSLGERAHRQRAVDRFDHFLVRTEYDAHTLTPALGVPERKLLRTGYPRNDALVAARRREQRTDRREYGPLAAEFDRPGGRPVVLYAPTFRGPAIPRPVAAPPLDLGLDLGLDLVEFARRLGDRYTLLVRAHYLSRLTVSPACGDRVRDVSGFGDVTELLLVADALITDYSSVLFDYALLDRPTVLFTPDHEQYTGQSRGARGTYLDLPATAPGPVAGTQRELFAALEQLHLEQRHHEQRHHGQLHLGQPHRGDVRHLVDADPDHAAARRRLVTDHGELDRGDAAQRVVRLLTTPWEHHR